MGIQTILVIQRAAKETRKAIDKIAFVRIGWYCGTFFKSNAREGDIDP
jgi:hypothetical protein